MLLSFKDSLELRGRNVQGPVGMGNVTKVKCKKTYRNNNMCEQGLREKEDKVYTVTLTTLKIS